MSGSPSIFDILTSVDATGLNPPKSIEECYGGIIPAHGKLRGLKQASEKTRWLLRRHRSRHHAVIRHRRVLRITNGERSFRRPDDLKSLTILYRQRQADHSFPRGWLWHVTTD